MSETCSAHEKWNKIASDIKLVFHSSTKFKLKFFTHHQVYFTNACLSQYQLHTHKLLVNVFLATTYGFTFTNVHVVPTQCIYVFYMDQRLSPHSHNHTAPHLRRPPASTCHTQSDSQYAQSNTPSIQVPLCVAPLCDSTQSAHKVPNTGNSEEGIFRSLNTERKWEMNVSLLVVTAELTV